MRRVETRAMGLIAAVAVATVGSLFLMAEGVGLIVKMAGIGSPETAAWAVGMGVACGGMILYAVACDGARWVGWLKIRRKGRTST